MGNFLLKGMLKGIKLEDEYLMVNAQSWKAVEA